jgi:nitroreductase
MNKEAITNFDILPILKKRWSPRAFSDQVLTNEQLQRFFEAARWSPSASNEQPWAFVVGKKGDESYQKIFSTLVEFNQLWCQFAPVLAIGFSRIHNNKGDINYYGRYDLGQSVAHLSFQAHAEGLYVHQMGGFDVEKAVELFEFPKDYEAVTAFAIGYVGDPEILHPNLMKMEILERERINAGDFVFSGKFGNKSDIY